MKVKKSSVATKHHIDAKATKYPKSSPYALYSKSSETIQDLCD